MAERITRQDIAAQALVHTTLPGALQEHAAAQPPVDRTFELPGGLYQTLVALLLGFVAVMGLGFGNLEMAIPLVIFAFFILAGFALPKIWAELAPESGRRAKSWTRFQSEGIMTATGRTSARDASVQVLLLPGLVFAWGLIAVVIAALV